MSIHSSLKVSMASARKRSVLKRAERLKQLGENGRWEEGKDSIFGLPKTKVVIVTTGKKKKKKKKDEEEGTTTAAAK